jgi:cytidylate kinase
MGYQFLDTGAMYRGVAYAHMKEKPKELDTFLAHLDLTFSFDARTRVCLFGEDVSDRIRSPEISMLASSLSQDRRVRNYLTGLQREMGKAGGIVVEGRDTGSVVFPRAEAKFYLDANIEERAKRRYRELAAKETGTDMDKVKEDIEKRDRDDSERDIAPLTVPEGALHIDTTGKTIEEVVAELEAHVRQVQG